MARFIKGWRKPDGWYLAAVLPCALLIAGNALAADNTTVKKAVLQTGVTEEGKLNSSVKVLPGTLNGSGQAPPIQQFAASGTYQPGQAAPIPKVPLKAVAQPPLVGGLGFRPGTPAINPPPQIQSMPPPVPKWNYTATPRNGLQDYSNGPHIMVETPKTAPTLPPKSFHNFNDFFRKSGQGPMETSFHGNNRILGRPASPPAVVPLRATAQAMPGVAVPKVATWDEWYQRTTKAIYEQWNRTRTGPGTARVKIVVFKSHDVDCQILDFTPVEDVARNAESETQFRESAIHSVNNLRHCEILGFPYSSTKEKVSFELNMTRSVNGPAGCDLKAIDTKDLTEK